MFVRQIVVAITLCLAPLAAHTADNDDFNPYKNCKVGDYATYKVTVKFGDYSIAASANQTVIAKTDKEATIRVLGSVSGMELPPQTQIIDLTKPYDPTKTTGFPAGLDGSVEKLKDGKEKVKVGTKEYDTTWTSYKVKLKATGNTLEGTAKTWMSKDVPLGVVKSEIIADEKKANANAKTEKIEMTMELIESGNKK